VEGMLGLSNRELQPTMINMLRAIMDKIDSMQEQMDFISRERKS
jgi:hypothetical protein